ncbi:hypothetical protein Y032_0117g693 [Ancylostoma ceylanicum]|uniref:Uncharacterized protein n=1 Tax=Ancylostoma ceylanicum TaxID=53326 RepID=A0A016TC43_9BILA|nr:hypothetical protein Y032_0117g693 [Ancylostoma ceylanicum]
MCPLGRSTSLITDLKAVSSHKLNDLLILSISCEFAWGEAEACSHGLSTTLIAIEGPFFRVFCFGMMEGARNG